MKSFFPSITTIILHCCLSRDLNYCCVVCCVSEFCWLINKGVYSLRFDLVAILAPTMSTNAVT